MTEQSKPVDLYELGFRPVGTIESGLISSSADDVPGWGSPDAPRERSVTVEWKTTDVNPEMMRILFGPGVWTLEKLTRWARFKRWVRQNWTRMRR